MLARSTLTKRSQGRYVSRSATIVRVTGSRRDAAARARSRTVAGSAAAGSDAADAAIAAIRSLL